MVPVLGFAAPSGSGKTTLMAGVIQVLAAHGLRVGAIKHGHHPADPDVPGKDTHRFRTAGAQTVLFACPERWFMIQELAGREEPPMAALVERLGEHDLVLVEGYKETGHPKIVIHRRAAGNDPLWYRTLTRVVAVASDDPRLALDVPLLPLDQPAVVAAFIRTTLGV